VSQHAGRDVTQLKVQQKLQTVSNLLRNNSHKKTLPNQTAIRVKFFLQLVFSEDKLGKELKSLDYDSLLLCGLSYTIKELRGLPSLELKFLIKHTPEFLKHRDLTPYLCRHDIHDSISKVQETSDEESFNRFLSCSSPSCRFRY
jgi:hypothetical protein